MSDFSEASTEARWYVAHTYSGYENKVKANLEKIIENRSIQHLIMDIRIPTEMVEETGFPAKNFILFRPAKEKNLPAPEK